MSRLRKDQRVYSLIAVMVCAFSGCPQPMGPEILVESTGEARVVIELIDLGSAANRLEPSSIIVFGTFDKATHTITPLAGEFNEVDGSLIFTPFQRLSREGFYAAKDLVRGGMTIYDYTTYFRQDRNTAVWIYPPESAHIPANHLKFYVHFDEPMQPTESWKHFSLLDLSTGELVPRPFRHIELWDEDNQRLTLWFHPGRQKTGVNLNEDLGAILTEGHEYLLKIDKSWKTQAGYPLSRDEMHAFTTFAADHEQPAPEKWTLTAPTVNSKEPLLIAFSEALDFAMVGKMITSCTIDGEILELIHQPELNGKGLQLLNDGIWTAGQYVLQLNPRLEDLAGNSLERPFEVDLQSDQSDFAKRLTLTFEVR